VPEGADEEVALVPDLLRTLGVKLPLPDGEGQEGEDQRVERGTMARRILSFKVQESIRS